jgi:hypothetical protein
MKKLPYFKFYIQDFIAYKDIIKPEVFYEMLTSVNHFILTEEHTFKSKNNAEKNFYELLISWKNESDINYTNSIENGKKGGAPKGSKNNARGNN